MRNRVAAFLIALQAAALVASCQASTGVAGPKPKGTGKAGVQALDRGPQPGPTGPSATPEAPREPLFPPLPTTPAATPTPMIAGTAAPTAAPLLAAPTLGPPASGVVANNGASLAGLVRAPAGLLAVSGSGVVANNGASLIGNNMAGVVANNGASYRLAALPEQVPVAGLAIGLVDARGALVTDASGKPLITRTAADGSYAFPDAPLDRSLFVLLDLPGGHGQLVAVAPKAAAPGRKVDLDLISTLTTGYIYNQFVAWQQDPDAVLAKLPADVEATTRARAAAAFVASGAPVPERLDTSEVNATVAHMRADDQAFDAQVEVVKRLLVVAGQADLGNGRLAIEVPWGNVSMTLHGPDGRLYYAMRDEERIWRLELDGRITAIAGGGAWQQGSVDGKPGPEAGLQGMSGFCFDQRGRLLILESDTAFKRVTRLDPDGRLREIHRMTGDGENALHAAVPGPGDEVRLLASVAGKLVYQAVTPGQAPRDLHVFPAADATRVGSQILAYGADARGRLLVSAQGPDGAEAFRFDPESKALEALGGPPSSAGKHMFDPAGRVFRLDYAKSAIELIDDDGAEVVAAGYGAGPYVTSITLGPDGAVWLMSVEGQPGLFRLADGKATRVGGATGGSSGEATALALELPRGVLALPDGAFLVADVGTDRLLRVGPDGKVTMLVGKPGDQPAGTAAPLATFALAGALARGADGTLYVAEDKGWDAAGRVVAIAPGGTTSTAYQPSQAGPISSLAVATDGTLFVAALGDVMRVPPGGGAAEKIYAFDPSDPYVNFARNPHLGLSPAGTLYIAHYGKLSRWTAAAGVERLATGYTIQTWIEGGSLAVDAQERVYAAYDLKVQRHAAPNWGGPPSWDPVLVAGLQLPDTPAPNFGGSGPDDSLNKPCAVALEADGDLLIVDQGHRQIKRVPAAKLP